MLNSKQLLNKYQDYSHRMITCRTKLTLYLNRLTNCSNKLPSWDHYKLNMTNVNNRVSLYKFRLIMFHRPTNRSLLNWTTARTNSTKPMLKLKTLLLNANLNFRTAMLRDKHLKVNFRELNRLLNNVTSRSVNWLNRYKNLMFKTHNVELWGNNLRDARATYRQPASNYRAFRAI